MIRQFDSELRKVSNNDERPFICDGSPLQCNVFIVGLNPVSKTPFWNYWHPEKGFNRNEWFEAYLKERKGKPTPTRKKLQYFHEEFRNSEKIRLLETNIYSNSSKRAGGLKEEDMSSQTFNFLLKVIKPKAIIAHGKTIRRYIWHLSGCSFDNLDKWTGERKVFDFKTRIYGRHHLSFQLSDDACRNLTKDLSKDLHGFLN